MLRDNNHTFLFVKRSCPDFFVFFKNFLEIVLDRPDAGYEAEPSEAVLVAFSLAEDFELSVGFDCSVFF